MGYTPPTLEELQQLPLELERHYHNGNPERKKLIAFNKYLLTHAELIKSPHAVNILVGANLFLMEMIWETYTATDPRGGLFNRGSSVYKMMEAQLKINGANKLTHQQTLIYLAKFYQYLSDHMPDMLPEGMPWATKDDLVKKYIDTLKAVVRRQNDEVNMMLTAPPTAPQLRHNLRDVEKRYVAASKEADKKKWVSSGMKHLPYAKLIDLVNEYCDLYIADVIKPDNGDSDLGADLSTSNMLRFAIALYAMQMIENEYKGYYVVPGSSPSNSLLYKMCSGEEGINAPSALSVPVQNRLIHIGMLYHVIDHMTKQGKDFVARKEKDGYKHLPDILGKVLENCSSTLTEYHAEKNAGSRVKGAMVCATSGVTQYGINALLRNVVGSAIPTPLTAAFKVTTGAAIGTALAAVGIGPAGAIFLGATISSTISNHVLPAALSGIIAGGMEAVGTGVGNVVTNVVIFPIRLTAEVLYTLASLRSQDPIDINTLRQDKEWIAALLTLPPEVFSDKDKRVLACTTGAKPLTM